MTCWRPLEEWNQTGVWTRLHQILPQELHQAGKVDWYPRGFGRLLVRRQP